FTSSSRLDSSLNLVFFGSDEFSIAHLTKLNDLKSKLPNTIDSLHVAVRKPKPSGQGLRFIREVPLSFVARDLGLELHEVETSEDFKKLEQLKFDLAIAVSYGKLIPGKFLSSLPYGGINVHPSLLPNYKGPAPLQWAILNSEHSTGVSIQTLHPTKFDQGQILWQSNRFKIDPKETMISLRQKLASVGSAALEEMCLKLSKLDNPDDYSKEFPPVKSEYSSLKTAPKITTDIARIDWINDDAVRIDRVFRGLCKPLFTFKSVPKRRNKGIVRRRVLLNNISIGDDFTTGRRIPGEYFIHNGDLHVQTVKGTIKVKSVKIE
ncbi:formyl transferase, partial [Dipodascopsis uninucleata]